MNDRVDEIGKSQIQACVCGFYFPDYCLFWMVDCICSWFLFYFNYIMEKVCIRDSEVGWSENSLDGDGRKC